MGEHTDPNSQALSFVMGPKKKKKKKAKIILGRDLSPPAHFLQNKSFTSAGASPETDLPELPTPKTRK